MRSAGAMAILLVTGCAGGGTSPPADTGGLDDGAHLTQPLDIAAGQAVTIPAGAKIVVDPGVTITVHGVLTVMSGAAHASVSATTPHPDLMHAWGGLVVDSGGELMADGLDLEGASQALWIKAGSVGAEYDDGTIADAQVPIQIDVGARLDTAHAQVVNPAEASGVAGALHASYLDYAAAPVAGGLVTMDPAAVFDVTDSSFHGNGAASSVGDFITSYASALVHVAYSTIADAHCAFHFDDVAEFEIDHVTAGGTSPTVSPPEVVYGAMLYGSGNGPNVISNSNFMGTEYDLDQQNANGPLTITNTYSTGHNSTANTWTWTPADVAKAPIADAKPR